jgi:ribosomal protein S18 acetylase RimI-like enzyme
MAMRLGVRSTQMPDRTFDGVELRRLDWDTTHFGQKMGVLAFTPTVTSLSPAALARHLRRALVEATADGYVHVIIRAPAEGLGLARAAEQSGLRLVDVAVDLETTLAGRQAHASIRDGIRAATPGDLGSLQSIAETAFEFSRFATDPFFSDRQVAGFYRQWIANLSGGLAKAVLVAESSDEIVGFTTCSLQDEGSGRIPLIATSELHRRQGIGRALVDASLRWFAAAGVKRVRVKTQAANYAALAMYHRAGFTVAAAELTFSATLDSPGAFGS